MVIPIGGGTGTNDLTIEEEVIEADDEDALFQSSGNDNSIWNECIVLNRYEQDMHRYMTGVTSPGGFNGGKAVFFQLATPTILWIADWTVYKSNDTPETPDPNPSDSNWVYLGAFPAESANLTIAPNGRSGRFRLSGTYVYGHLNPPASVWDLVTFGKPPWLQGGVLPRRITQDKLVHGIIDDEGENVGGGTHTLRHPVEGNKFTL